MVKKKLKKAQFSNERIDELVEDQNNPTPQIDKDKK